MRMAVYFADEPPERAPAFRQVCAVEDVRGQPESLLTVPVQNHGQIIEVVMRGEHRCFPDRALVAFRIADQAKYATSGTLKFRCERGACRHTKALTQ